MEYFAFDKYNGEYEFFETEQKAKEEADGYLEVYAGESRIEGWPEDLSGMIGYGKILATTTENLIADKKDFTDEEWEEEGYSFDWDKIIDYPLTKISDTKHERKIKDGT